MHTTPNQSISSIATVTEPLWPLWPSWSHRQLPLRQSTRPPFQGLRLHRALTCFNKVLLQTSVFNCSCKTTQSSKISQDGALLRFGSSGGGGWSALPGHLILYHHPPITHVLWRNLFVYHGAIVPLTKLNIHMLVASIDRYIVAICLFVGCMLSQYSYRDSILKLQFCFFCS